MANVNAPFGMLPVGTKEGSPYNGRTAMYVIPLADGSVYSLGDMVISAANADANGIPAVAKATGALTARGMIVGVYPVTPNLPSLQGLSLTLETLTIPATKTRDFYVAVCDNPDIVFEMQGDVTGTNQVAANANKNASITVTNPTAGAYSASVINSGSINTTQALNIKLMGLAQRPNNAFGASAVWRCCFNQHELMGNTAGI